MWMIFKYNEEIYILKDILVLIDVFYVMVYLLYLLIGRCKSVEIFYFQNNKQFMYEFYMYIMYLYYIYKMYVFLN